jgi:hypothetical protein
MAKKSKRTTAGKSKKAAAKTAPPKKNAVKKNAAKKAKAKAAKVSVTAAKPASKPQARPPLVAPLGGAMGFAGAASFIDQITALAAQSNIAKFRWKDEAAVRARRPSPTSRAWPSFTPGFTAN